MYVCVCMRMYVCVCVGWMIVVNVNVWVYED